MKGIVATAIALLSMTFMAQSAAHAAGPYNDVVIDKNNHIVHDMRGGCVYTKWVGKDNKCAPKQTKKHTYTRPYLVFFDFDKSNITPEADKIISALYSDAKKAVKAWYHITGHADRSGTDAYNMTLSKHRAEAAKSRLMQLGVPAGNISIDYKGERNPLVKTPDGVREPQNRRAEIKLTVEKVKR